MYVYICIYVCVCIYMYKIIGANFFNIDSNFNRLKSYGGQRKQSEDVLKLAA